MKEDEQKSAKKKEASWKKEQGHLFVPSCVAKMLTEAILYDIGESLQSKELHEEKRGRRKKESIERWGGCYIKRKEEKGLTEKPLMLVEKQLPCANYLSGHASCISDYISNRSAAV